MPVRPHSAFQSPKGPATLLDLFSCFLFPSPSLDALLPGQQHPGLLSGPCDRFHAGS